MRWFGFAILALGALVVQTGASRVFSLGSGRIMPDLLLLVAVVLAFRAEGDSAMLACWLLGLLKDLTSEAVLGSYALSFGVLALVILQLREFLYGERLLTMMLLVFVSSFALEQFAFLIYLLKGEPIGDQYGKFSLAMFFSSLLTSALLPYVQWLLLKFHRQLGLPRRRGYRLSR